MPSIKVLFKNFVSEISRVIAFPAIRRKALLEQFDMTDYYPTILGSASAGLISRVVCHPIDTIKSRLQAGQSAFRSVEGIGALYRGIGAVVVGGVPGVCIYMTTYEVTNKHACLPLLIEKLTCIPTS